VKNQTKIKGIKKQIRFAKNPAIFLLAKNPDKWQRQRSLLESKNETIFAISLLAKNPDK